MTGLIEDIEFSEYTRFDVVVTDDYCVEGSFSHNAVSDYDYYGFRDTIFTVTKAVGSCSAGEWELNEEELGLFIKQNEDRITLLVQDKLDDMRNDV